MHRLCLWLILLLTLTLAGCDGAREPAPESQRETLDYSWVATTPREELAGNFDRANVFIYADYYRRQRAYASGEIPPRLLSDSYTSHPLAYYTLKREPAVRTPAEVQARASGRSGCTALCSAVSPTTISVTSMAPSQSSAVPFNSTAGMRAHTPFGRSPMGTWEILPRPKQTCKAQSA